MMNFMLHITLDAEDDRLRALKCEMWCVIFTRWRSTLFRWGGYIFHVCEKRFFI